MKTFLDWSAYENAGMGDAYADIPKTGGDYAKAIAACIGSRQCENKGKGVMCPSFRVTDDPDQSTGGRVRLLKAALNGELGEAALADPVLGRAMDLCVGCKGCKRECENEVDMATIKVEYLAQRQAQTGIPLRTRLFASLPVWLHRYPWLKPLPAWRNRWPALAWLGQRLIGISARRQLPEPAAAGLAPEWGAEDGGPITQDGREVVLWVDSFSRYFEPEIARAARQVLTRAGYRVQVAQPLADDAEPGRPLCCGRTFFAHGMVDEARAEARRMLAALRPHLEAGRAIVGLEPSCVLSLRDEFKALNLGGVAEQLASKALLFEEFLAREQTAKRLELDLSAFSASDRPALIHGHCHQKAVGAMKSMRKVLKLIPGFKFELVESTCCGMAGSFGLEAEHVDAAMAMAEQSLLPALRAAEGATVVANGFSCRHQIRESLGREPVHLAVLLRDALATAEAGS